MRYILDERFLLLEADDNFELDYDTEPTEGSTEASNEAETSENGNYSVDGPDDLSENDTKRVQQWSDIIKNNKISWDMLSKKFSAANSTPFWNGIAQGITFKMLQDAGKPGSNDKALKQLINEIDRAKATFGLAEDWEEAGLVFGYYRTYWQESAKAASNLGITFIDLLRKKGFTKNTNAYVRFFSSNAEDSSFPNKNFPRLNVAEREKFKAVVDSDMAAEDVSGAGRFKTANIIYSNSFWKRPIDEVKRLLQLQKVLLNSYTINIDTFKKCFYENGQLRPVAEIEATLDAQGIDTEDDSVSTSDMVQEIISKIKSQGVARQAFAVAVETVALDKDKLIAAIKEAEIPAPEAFIQTNRDKNYPNFEQSNNIKKILRADKIRDPKIAAELITELAKMLKPAP